MTQIVPLLWELQAMYGSLDREGFVKTSLPGVRLFWATKPIKRAPLFVEAGIVMIFQGHNIGYLDNRAFRYDSNNYLVLTMPIAFECETHASPDKPLLGLFIDLDKPVLHELVALVGKHRVLPQLETSLGLRAVEPVALDRGMAEAAERLLSCLRSPLDSDVLGPSLVREIIYRALLGQHGYALYALTQDNCHCARIAKALARIHREYTKPLTVESLALEARMSVSAFHRAFKQITGSSPLQYLKKMRLNKAKNLIAHGGIRVGQAAHQVGYESVSQFSREFKRYFKVPPKEASNIQYTYISAI